MFILNLIVNFLILSDIDHLSSLSIIRSSEEVQKKVDARVAHPKKNSAQIEDNKWKIKSGRQRLLIFLCV